jgi:hypothetical protein
MDSECFSTGFYIKNLIAAGKNTHLLLDNIFKIKGAVMRKRSLFLPSVLLSMIFLITNVAEASTPLISGAPNPYRAGTLPVQSGTHNDVVPLSGPGAASNMLQFRAGGHVLGFQPKKVYLAGLDHALSVEFLGTPRGNAEGRCVC